jgi:hypothetical protein
MMSYVKASGQNIIEYPYTLAKLKADNPNTSFPREVLSNELLAEFGVYPVLDTAQPTPGEFERVVEALPVFSDGAWRKQWQTVPAPVPKKITPRQCRLVLMSQGLLATVEQAIAGMDEATRITWEYALEFRRDDPLLNALGKNMNLTDEQIDQFFIAASKL